MAAAAPAPARLRSRHLENIRGLGVRADLFPSGWASQTGLTNDLIGSATAGGISDSSMRPQGFCAHRDRGRRAIVVGDTEEKEKKKLV